MYVLKRKIKRLMFFTFNKLAKLAFKIMDMCRKNIFIYKKLYKLAIKVYRVKWYLFKFIFHRDYFKWEIIKEKEEIRHL